MSITDLPFAILISVKARGKIRADALVSEDSLLCRGSDGVSEQTNRKETPVVEVGAGSEHVPDCGHQVSLMNLLLGSVQTV